MHFVLSKGSAVGRPNQWSDLLTAVLAFYSLCICAINLYRVRIKPVEQITHSTMYKGKFVSWLRTTYKRIRCLR